MVATTAPPLRVSFMLSNLLEGVIRLSVFPPSLLRLIANRRKHGRGISSVERKKALEMVRIQPTARSKNQSTKRIQAMVHTFHASYLLFFDVDCISSKLYSLKVKICCEVRIPNIPFGMFDKIFAVMKSANRSGSRDGENCHWHERVRENEHFL